MKINFNFNVSINGSKENGRVLNNEKQRTSLVESVKREADVASSRHAYSTAANYITALHSLLRYLSVDDIDIESITSDTLIGWQRWLLNRNIELNTVSCYMRSLRSVLNRSIGEHTTLFQKVFTGMTRTVKRSISADDISRLLQLSLPRKSYLSFVRDIFIFSFYCQGMPFIDIALLRRQQLHDGYIHYARHKTGQPIKIAIDSHINRIIARYRDISSQYVFPIISATDAKEAFRQYNSQLSSYNRALKRLGRMANIQPTMSSYVARHSWASVAFQHNIDLNVISQAMGHTNTKTTMIYIRELDTAKLDEANRIVINSLHSNEIERK